MSKEYENFIDDILLDYIESHSTEEPSLLYDLKRQTYLRTMMPRMISGNIQGQFLRLFVKALKAERVLEIGTFTGYATICFAESLSGTGKIFTIDINEELEPFVRSYFEKSGFQNKIIYKIGDASEIIPQLNEKWDLVFLDADKENNLKYYELFFEQVKPGGFIFVDNVLWNNKVFYKEHNDKITTKVREFNQYIQQDSRVENVLLPIRDGLMMIRKKEIAF